MIVKCNTEFMRSKKAKTPKVSIAFLLSQVGGRAAEEFSKLLAPLNLTPPDAGILRLLNLSPGISQQELAGRLGMHASRLVAMIDTLEERGLVARTANVNDRRVYSLQLTDAGRDAWAAIGRLSQVHEDVMCAGLSETERKQLAGILKKIADRHGLAHGIHPGYRSLGQARAKGDAKAPGTKR
jgi:DNA-binding MarR family transcriptional regulator